MRRKDREITDINEIIEIIDKAKILNMAICDSPYPYIVTMHYGHAYVNGKLIFYLHSAKEGKKIELLNKNNKICFSIVTNVNLLEDDIPCKNSSTFSSIVGIGDVEFLTDNCEKIKAFNLLMKNQTGKTYNFTNEMVENVLILKINVLEFSCKENKK